MTRLLIYSFLFLFSKNLTAQLIRTEPAFPRADEAVTIYFDATQGTGGLENCGCTVYVHTGVITDKSSSSSDWKYVPTSWGVANPDWAMELVAGETNIYKYEVTPTIRDYYGVPNSEVIEKLALVFRNGDGSKEGKDEGGSDIFYDVNNSTGLVTSFVNPSNSQVVLESNEMLDIKAVSSLDGDLSLFDNGTLLTQTTGKEITYTVSNPTGGLHRIMFVAEAGSEKDTAYFSYIVPLTGNTENPDDGLEPGIFYKSDSDIRLKLYAPGKKHVFVLGDFNNWELNTDYQMKVDDSNSVFWLDISNLESGKMYAFQYLVDSELRIADPYTELVLDPWNDNGINRSLFPDLPTYPSSKTTGITSILQPGKSAYDWQTTDFEKPEQDRLVIYELLMRDFLSSHNYKTLEDSLDYFKTLGINAIEFMPVNEFEGNDSWGYNPSFHAALDKYYGSPEQFKSFIDACHAKGIAVILDVVYNHAFSQSPLCQLYWDDANFRPSASSPYFNQTAKHDFNVGYDFNHESEATKVFVKKTLKYWLEEYKIDGFRFDLSKGFTQKNTLGNIGAWSSFDQSRVDILKDYADAIWDVTSDAYVILEHFGANNEEKNYSDYKNGMMVWQNMNHEFSEAGMGYSNNLNGLDYTARGFTNNTGIAYKESHDEERNMYKSITWGNGQGDHDVKELPTGLRRQEMTNMFFYLTSGPRMIWQFGEVGYDFSINRCTNGTVDPDCRLSRKPIRWDYLQDPIRRRLYDVTSTILDLRNTHEVFHSNITNKSLSGQLTRWALMEDSEMDAMILGNTDVKSAFVLPVFSKTGTWYEYFTGEEIDVVDVNGFFDLQPGEYRLYTTIKLPEPPMGYISTNSLTEVEPSFFDFKIGPNPAANQTTVFYDLKNAGQVEINIFDLSGKIIQPIFAGRQQIGAQQILINNLPARGMYWLQMIVDEKSAILPLVIK